MECILMVRIMRRGFGSAEKTEPRDRGKELTDYRRFSLAADIAVDFCDPRNP